MPSISAESWGNRNLTRQLISLLLCFMSLTSYRADACIIFGDFDINLITQADSIYVGTVNNYEVVKYEGVFGDRLEYGLIYFSVKRVLKGEGHGDVKLFLPPSNFGIPQEIMVSKSPFIENAAIIAISGRSIYEKPTFLQRFENGSIFIHQPPILPEIASVPCARDFVLPFSPELEILVRGALRGKAIKDADEAIYGGLFDPIEIKGKIKNMRSVTIPPEILALVTLLLILLIAMSPVFVIFRWVKRRKSFEAKS